jgi:hypothetical protein
MSTYKYTFTQVDTNNVVSQDFYSEVDSDLINDFKVNSSFNKDTDFIELHYYSLDNRKLKTIPDYTNFSSNQDSGTANEGTLDTLKLELETDLLVGEYEAGEVFLSYNFLSDPFTETKESVDFFIEEISGDRFELRLLTTELRDEDLNRGVTLVKERLENPETSDFYLNFGNNDLILALNIDTLAYREFTSVVVKLYNPLTENFGVKSRLKVNFKKADSVTFKSSATLEQEKPRRQYLKGPNFNLNQFEETGNPTGYLSITDAFTQPISSSHYEVKSIFEEKGAELSIDYSDYGNFINFSSAKERLENFKYKFDLILNYQSASIARSSTAAPSSIYSSSREYYDDKISTILANFDHYDRFLYYETGSHSWPKSGDSKPYALLTGSATGSWYSTQIISASEYDDQNANQLLNTIPTYLRDDPNNSKYKTFIYMISQHFDNLWIYSRAVTEKYNADNRIDKGISKDLIEDALKNFGVKLYSSNKSTLDLFKMFTGESLTLDSPEIIEEFNQRVNSATLISGSQQPTSEQDYRKQIYKRLYHNLPLLLKSKGTERGLRAVLSSFGVPSIYSSGSISNTGSLFITQDGGTISGSFNLGGQQYVTSSLDRIRIDNTGSVLDNTLSQFTSIVKRDNKYANDYNTLEVGYSPATYINNLIIASASADSFDLDSILGDPRYAYSSSYEELTAKVGEYLTPITEKYNLKDFTRLLKYYDNVLFKTVRDFIPARSNASTGIIIKPHLLERSKAKQVETITERHNEFSASIEVGIRSGSHGDAFGARDTYLTSYTSSLMTSGGLADSQQYLHEEPKFNGELSGSYLEISTGELNDENLFKYDDPVISSFSYNFIDASIDCEIRFDEYTPPPPTPTPTPTPTITPTPTPAPDCNFTLTGQEIPAP